MANSKTHITNPLSWVDDYGDYLYAYAFKKLLSKDLAEDLLQDAFLAAFQAKESFKGKSTEKTWLASILKRKIADYYRQLAKNRERTFSDNSSFITDKFMHGQWKEEKAPLVWDMDGDWAKDERFLEIIRKCITFLPPKWKAVFALKHMEDTNTQKISEDLKVSESNIWVILHRSRLQLRACIEQLLQEDHLK